MESKRTTLPAIEILILSRRPKFSHGSLRMSRKAVENPKW
jgi:hypothetical protein